MLAQFNNGEWRGRTDATIEGIARTLDEFREEVHGKLLNLPCSKEIERRVKLEAHLVYIWLIMATSCTVGVGVAVKMFFFGR